MLGGCSGAPFPDGLCSAFSFLRTASQRPCPGHVTRGSVLFPEQRAWHVDWVISWSSLEFWGSAMLSRFLLPGCLGPVSRMWVPSHVSFIWAGLVPGWAGTFPPLPGILYAPPLLASGLQELFLASKCCPQLLPAHPGPRSRGRLSSSPSPDHAQCPAGPQLPIPEPISGSWFPLSEALRKVQLAPQTQTPGWAPSFSGRVLWGPSTCLLHV